jgi:hypothetical protein
MVILYCKLKLGRASVLPFLLLLIFIFTTACNSITPTVPVISTPTVPNFTPSPTVIIPQSTGTIPLPSPTFSIPTTIATSQIPSTSPADAATAWGANFKETKIPIAIGNDLIFIAINATPDAKYLLGSKRPRKFGSEIHVFTVLEISTGKFTQIQKLATPTSQVIAVTADDKWIVWAEAARQPDLGDWMLYSYNRENRQIKRIAQAPLGADGKPLASPYLQPMVD